ncbi:hypothetical protein GQ42DRAFT_176216 [Ramicandelaber brevisporus]|nr:hypothetical protein GQ42DRAFT_176216 [Ramicandelaber brevisporus]
MAIASVALVKYTEHYIRPYSRCKDMPSKWPHHCMVLLPIDPDHPHTPGVIQRINSEYHSIVMYYSPGALPPIDPEMHLFEFTPQDSPHLPLTQFGGKAASTSAPYTCPGLDPNDEASLRLFRYGFVPFDIQRTRNFVTNIVVGRELGQELYNRVIANTTSQLSFGLSYDRDLPNVTFVYEEDIKWPDGWYMAREGDALGRVFSGLLGGEPRNGNNNDGYKNKNNSRERSYCQKHQI